MKNFNKLATYGAALLMAVSMGSSYAEEGDMTRTRTQNHEYSGDYSEAQKGEQKQYKYRKNNQSQQSSTSSGSMGGEMKRSRSMGGGRR